MNIVVKCTKIITKSDLKMSKIFIHHDQVGFTPGMQGWSNIKKRITIILPINRIKNENHMITSIDSGKPFEKSKTY